MADPITLGSLIAAALAAGASEAGKAALGAAAMDAYQALKAAAGRLLGPAAEQLEARPDSEHRAGVVAELVDELPDPDRHALGQLAEALRAALAAEGRGATIDNSVTVTASGAGAIAAGRDVTVGLPPKPGGSG